MTRWGPMAIVVGLLAATAVAFATTERQKLEKTPFAVLRVDRVFSPVCRCPARVARIELRFRRSHVVTLRIVDGRGRAVATLANERVVSGRVDYAWAGRHVLDGVYTPEVTLDDAREFAFPNPIRLDSTAPQATVLSYRPHLLKRRVKPRVLISYRVSEIAHPILYVNGRRVFRGYAKALQAKIEWFARRAGTRLRPGRYRLQLAAVDLAGNIGPRSQPFVVRVR